jgi:hypothetical protein
VLLDHLLHQAQAEPGAGDPGRVRRAVERAEDLLAVLRRDAEPLIADADDRRGACGPSGDLDAAATRRVLDRVGEQVDEDLADLLVSPQTDRGSPARSWTIWCALDSS